MARVGFIITHRNKNEWIGGYNYIRNLLQAVRDTVNVKDAITPVIITGYSHDVTDLTNEFKGIEVIRTKLLDGRSPTWFVSRTMRKLWKRDLLLDGLLKRKRIDLISHISIGLRLRVPSVGWIPDFQHVYLPQFFDRAEIDSRNRIYRDMCRYCSSIIVSSHAAAKDLEVFAPDEGYKSKVLHFVAEPIKSSTANADTAPPRVKYDLPERYYHLPNQYWKHKNHETVIQALRILRASGREISVVSTGSTSDYRHPGHFGQITSLLRRYGLEDRFKILGVISYEEMTAVMRNSVAVINPSLFEGWSTTVEEAKAIGKRAVLSDILVHREQNPRHSHFFDPMNPAELAEILWSLWLEEEHAGTPFAEDPERLRTDLAERKRTFGHQYRTIVEEALHS
ncbi:glycosyltransferase family 4 protein [Cohnella sp. GCM10027633]|uniref:glycosyltransferase family 4 protein n=1 Tax=unclassified Cohnella TaxID=2636738 RepID=UPI00362917D9